MPDEVEKMAANEQFIFTGYFRCSGRRDSGNHSDHVDLHSNTAKKLSENISQCKPDFHRTNQH